MEKTLKINLEKHPELRLAHELTVLIPEAIIAGGCPRDLINDIDIADVDVFIEYEGDTELLEVADKVTTLLKAHDIEYQFKEGYDIEREIIVGARILAGNLDINFMETCALSKEILFEQFDLVSSQAWLKRTEEGFIAKATDYFHALNERKVLGYFIVTVHMDKIKKKYKGYLPMRVDRKYKAEPKAA